MYQCVCANKAEQTESETKYYLFYKAPHECCGCMKRQ